MPKPAVVRATAHQPLVNALSLSVLSGLMLGLSFPPVDFKWLVWVGLSPLILVIFQETDGKRVFVFGAITGLVFFLMNLHPLVSAHSWTGWASESSEAFSRRMAQQWWFMQGIWVAFALWCAFWVGAWAWLLRHLCFNRPFRFLLVAPMIWIVAVEWLRMHTTFGFAWAFLGNATADLPAVRQLAAFGGVRLLSAVVVLFNVGLAMALKRPQSTAYRRASLVAVILTTAAVLLGAARLREPISGSAITVAVLQRSKPSYAVEDFSRSTGFDKNYIPMIQQALEKKAALIMLPESIALGAMTLDGSPSSSKPQEWLHPLPAWNKQMADLLGASTAVIMLGIDTVEQSKDHNTLIAFSGDKTLGWYHKRRLVPFAEYEPWSWAPWAISGKSQYASGTGSQLIRLPDGLLAGGFICQEVLFPWVTRSSVRDGATVLVTGGNDGVFGDPAVARVHADAAQIRAVESGRYIIRAMKTGISGIIDPQGRETVRTESSEPAILFESVAPQHRQTPYTTYGDWIILLAACTMIAGVALRPKAP